VQPSGIPKAHLGRYELVAKLAAGGMGEIFLARLAGAAGFEKLVVVKRILPHLADDARFRAMLIDEARIASRLSHPNICQVHELGETGGELYIVMEYLEGATLLPLLRHANRQRLPLELGMIANVLQQVCEGLHFAHELRDRDGASLNIIHRDVTPSNIFITDSGVSKVLDFGIAKAKDVSNDTQTGTIKGKHAYMAPEQLHGVQLDRRVDVFAAGILLFEMLTLRRLFQRRTDYLTLQAVMDEPIARVSHYRRDVPPALATVLERALQRQRSERFDTVRLFGAAVVEAIGSQQRVWTTSELADELTLRFRSEIEHRRAAVQAAVAGSGTLPGLPSLEELAVPGSGGDDERQRDDGDGSDDDLPLLDDSLPELVSGGAPTRVEWNLRTLAAAAAAATPVADSDAANGATAAAGSPPGRDALTGPAAAAAATSPRRSWGGALFAVSLLLLGLAGLAVLWRSNQPPQTVLVVQERAILDAQRAPPPRDASPRDDAAPSAQPEPSAASALDAGASDPPSGGGDARRPKRGSEAALRAQLDALRPELRGCQDERVVTNHPGEFTAEVEIDRGGRVSSVALRPAELDSTALGACIKRTLAAQRFGRQREALVVTLPFVLPRRRPQ
jgi:eukaryotic-like serine/threonine-protein kinase